MKVLRKVTKFSEELDKIFNPPESEIDADSFIKFPKLVFRIVCFTFDPEKENVNRKERIVYLVKKKYYELCVLGLVVGGLMVLIFAVTTFENFAASAIPICNALGFFICQIRGLTTTLNRDNLRKIFDDLRLLTGFRAVDNSKYKIQKELNDFHKMAKVYTFMCLSVFTSVVSLQLLYFVKGVRIEVVPFWYPFDARREGIFPVTSIWTDWFYFNNAVLSLASESLLFALLTVIAMEFDILRTDIKEFGSVPADQRQKVIRNFTDHHTKLFEVRDKVQAIYGPDFLLSFVATSVILGIAIFSLVLGKNNFLTVAYLACGTGTIFMRMFLLSFFAQKMIDSSLSVADGVYESGWEEISDEKIKKSLILFIQRAHRPATLTAMNFADISLETFRKILTSTWSYFSLMRELYASEK